LYALVLAPAVWVLCGVGFTGDLIGRARDASGTIETFVGLLLLLLAGAAYAILIFAPISPAGPTLGGLAFFGIGLWAFAAPSSYAGVWPSTVSKNGFDLSRPGYGLALLLAVPMICTALSARRWAKYEPPVLPLIGALGRARGAAPVAGIPISVTETAILNARAPAPATEVIRLPAAEPPTEAVPTERVTLPDNGDEATTLLPTARAEAPTWAGRDDEATTPVSVPVAEQTAAQDDEATTVSVPVAEQTAAQDDEATTVLPSTASSAASFAVSSDVPTTALPALPVEGAPGGKEAEEEPGDATEAIEEGPTEAVVAAEEDATEAIAAPGEKPAEPVTEAVVTEAVDIDVDNDDETAAAAVAFAVVDEDGEEKTQVLRLPTAGKVTPARRDELPTDDVRGDEQTVEGARALDERPDLGRPMRDFGSSEKTQVIPRNPGETTQVIRRTGAIYLPPRETTRSIQTTLGAVEPPSERTQVIKLPTAPALHDGRSTPPPSIVGEERPDPGADPTTRLIPVPTSEDPTVEQKSGETTARTPGEASTAARQMTVLNMERPSDEAEEDTRPLTVPNQRQPQDD
jgi:hypothetical protein